MYGKFSRISFFISAACAILLISADLDEVIKLADRIAVLYEGRIVAEKETGAFTKTELGYYMLGGNARKEAADND